jgi:hypothetical protein
VKILLSSATAAAIAAALSIASPAAAQPTSGSSGCFRLSDMGNHSVVNNHTLYVSMGRKDVWRFDMSGACLAGAGPGDPLVITPAGGMSLICKPLDLDIKVSTIGGLSTCILSGMTRLTPQEAEAIPRKLRP